MTTTGLFQESLDKANIEYDDQLDHDVAELLSNNNMTLSCAESITGGLISQRITDLPGSSKYFTGSIVCYHTRLKILFCKVSPKTVKEHTVISSEVAAEMAEGFKNMTNTDYCISTTGIAGPSTKDYTDDLTGTVYVGINGKQKAFTKGYQFSGSRQAIRNQTCLTALSLLRQTLRNELEQ